MRHFVGAPKDVVKRARKANLGNDGRITSLEGTTVIFAPLDRTSNLAKLNHLKLSQFLTSELPGRIKEIRPNHAKNIIAVDVVAPAAKIALLQLERICTIPVRAYEPRPVNSSCGVTVGIDLSLSGSQITDAITSDPPLLVARRIRRDAGTVRLTFLGKTPPKSVSFQLLTMQVREYLPRVVQCDNCLRYGHVAACCSRRKMCPNCGTSHENPVCPESEPTCANCRGKHSASSGDCPLFKEQRRIARERSRSNSSYREAKAKVRHAKRSSKPKTYRRGMSPSKPGNPGARLPSKSPHASPQQVIWADTDFPPLEPTVVSVTEESLPPQIRKRKTTGPPTSPRPPAISSPAYQNALNRPQGTDLPLVIIQLLFAALKAIVSAVPGCTVLAEIQSILQTVIAPLLVSANKS
ncbi:uncharacterized protein LOC135397435 [Ornithodoros turicata]|uniref:uncharacterized protein LOC135397435 n=1 Tax=Ornithodoros turicata TaxID=34597 RepID=UPI003138A87D